MRVKMLLPMIMLIGAICLPAFALATYTVRPSDTIDSIARHYHVSASALMRQNNISDPRRLAVGAVLRIPSSGSVNGTASSSTYAVRAGDTLSGIARHFGLSLGRLAAANGITVNQALTVGQVLTIPGQSGQTASGPKGFVNLGISRDHHHRGGDDGRGEREGGNDRYFTPQSTQPGSTAGTPGGTAAPPGKVNIGLLRRHGDGGGEGDR